MPFAVEEIRHDKLLIINSEISLGLKVILHHETAYTSLLLFSIYTSWLFCWFGNMSGSKTVENVFTRNNYQRDVSFLNIDGLFVGLVHDQNYE